jgi:uncharacterized protein YjbI with pentapeptide repeats
MEYTSEELKEILRLHQGWIDKEDWGVQANLNGADLTEADLTEANLTGADLTGAFVTDDEDDEDDE